MDVTFEQLVGHTATKRGPVEVKLPVDRVRINGHQVGTAGRHKGAGFCPITYLSEAETAAIVEALDKRDFGDQQPTTERKVATLPPPAEEDDE